MYISIEHIHINIFRMCSGSFYPVTLLSKIVEQPTRNKIQRENT